MITILSSISVVPSASISRILSLVHPPAIVLVAPPRGVHHSWSVLYGLLQEIFHIARGRSLIIKLPSFVKRNIISLADGIRGDRRVGTPFLAWRGPTLGFFTTLIITRSPGLTVRITLVELSWGASIISSVIMASIIMPSVIVSIVVISPSLMSVVLPSVVISATLAHCAALFELIRVLDLDSSEADMGTIEVFKSYLCKVGVEILNECVSLKSFVLVNGYITVSQLSNPVKSVVNIIIGSLEVNIVHEQLLIVKS